MRAIIFLILVSYILGSNDAIPPRKKERIDRRYYPGSIRTKCEKCGEFIRSDINQGASTSSDTGLTRCEKCELENYVNRVVFLMFAEDKYSNEDLIYMMDNRYEEMRAFYEYVNSYIRFAALGPTRSQEQSVLNRIMRLKRFNQFIEELIQKIIQVTCTKHYRTKLFYKYDHDINQIIVHQTHTTVPDDCLCVDNENCNAQISETTFTTDSTAPLDDQKEDPQLKQVNQIWLNNMEGLRSGETTIYHIIPVQLISKFFRIWLKNYNGYPTQVPNFNNCVNVLLQRLTRSLKKIILVSIYNSGLRVSFSEVNDDEIFSTQALESSYSWLKGNMFVGPTNRGPFDPRFEVSDSDEAEAAFDYESEYIVGQRRYLELLRLFRSLQHYRLEVRFMRPVERLLEGFRIYTEMTLAFTTHGVAPINWADWEFREILKEELQKFYEDKEIPLKKLVSKTEKFYTTKKPNKRPERSVVLEEIESMILEEDSLKEKWSEFISSVMKITMEARSQNTTLPWMCDLTRLYEDYLFYKDSDYECSECLGFDEFLYTKILKPQNWNQCNNEASEVCHIWHNITVNPKIFNYLKNVRYNSADHEKWKPYFEKVTTMINWLSTPVHYNNPDNSEDSLFQMPKVAIKTSAIDEAVCYIFTIIPTLITRKSECNKFG